MTTDNKALNEKLAKWAGFKPLTHKEFWPNISTNMPDIIVAWEYPDGDRAYQLPELLESLDACFKWLVPKLEHFDLYGNVYGSHGWQASVDLPNSGMVKSLWQQSPTLALCLAIEKLIDTETKVSS